MKISLPNFFNPFVPHVIEVDDGSSKLYYIRKWDWLAWSYLDAADLSYFWLRKEHAGCFNSKKDAFDSLKRHRSGIGKAVVVRE